MWSNYILISFFSVIGLFSAGSVLVRSLIWLARYFRIGEYVLSLILVSSATSLDDLFVSASLTWQGAPLAALGNLVGANVLGVTLILGEAMILADYERRRLRARGIPDTEANDGAGELSKSDLLIILGMVLLPAFLMLDRMLSRMDGAILLFFFAGYAAYLFNEGRVALTAHPYHKIFPGIYYLERVKSASSSAEHGSVIKKYAFRPTNLIRHLSIFVGSLLVLLASAWFLAGAGVGIAGALRLPPFFIGILVALGTTLSEVAFNVRSILMRHSDMAFGNTLGSVVANTSFFLGVTIMISPIPVVNLFAPLLGIFLVAGFVLVIELVSFLHLSFPRSLGAALILFSFLFIGLEYWA